MSHVSFNRRSIAIIAILTMASSTVLAEEPLELGSYESYTTAVKQICYATDGENIPPWNSKVGTKQEIPKDLTKINLDFYPDMYDPNANEKFKKSLQAIKSDPDELQARVALESQNLPLASQIEKSSLVYKERMNNLYACAVLNAKYKINTRLTDQFKPAGTNIVRNLQQATQQIASQMSTRGCRNISAEEWDGSELSVKRSLIRGSILEYCNYRHYLEYVDYNVKNQLSRVIQNEDKIRGARAANPNDSNDRFPSSESIATAIDDINSRTTNEIAHTQQVFDDAFDSYREFEQTYASHVLMVLIEDRYILLREYLRDTMNPIWQVIYKASNASSKGK